MAKKKVGDLKLWGFLVMFLGPLGMAIAYLAKKHDNDYVVHYMKHMFTLGVALSLLSLVNIVPILGQLAWLAIGVVGIILWVIGWVYALSGEKKELPIVGEHAKEFFKGF